MRIIPVDCNYVQAEFASAYLLVEKNSGFFIECNTNYAIPFLLAAVEKEGLSAEDVRGLIITHVHLDHAGGAGLFLQTFPNAKLYAHPRAARHAIDPSKLIASATAVYGEAFMQKLYGTILPCDPNRVVILRDGATLDFEGITLQTKHTRGHANHHLVVIEPTLKTLFSGDSFGVSYSSLNEKHGLVMLASTSPTDFDGEAALATVDWIASQDLEKIALTHYGFILKADIQNAAEQLRAQIRFSMELVGRVQRENLLVEQVEALLQAELLQSKPELSRDELEHLNLDFKVNAQGLFFVAKAERQG